MFVTPDVNLFLSQACGALPVDRKILLSFQNSVLGKVNSGACLAVKQIKCVPLVTETWKRKTPPSLECETWSQEK